MYSLTTSITNIENKALEELVDQRESTIIIYALISNYTELIKIGTLVE